MTGHIAAFHARVQSTNDTHIAFTLCVINQEALVAKKLSPDLNEVVQNVVKVTNFIKSLALNYSTILKFVL